MKTGKAGHYRERAEELRVMVEDWKDRTAQDMLLLMACEYDRMAEVCERDEAERPSESRRTGGGEGHG